MIWPGTGGGDPLHVVRQLLEVLLLVGNLLLELQELLLLALAYGPILAGLLALLEGVAVSFMLA